MGLGMGQLSCQLAFYYLLYSVRSHSMDSH